MADFYHQYNVLVLSSFSLQYAIEVSHDLVRGGHKLESLYFVVFRALL